ncbi:MAG: tripartite tricarboxylate transporter substrate-binding protein [Pseudomonadota bacterium]
MKRILRAGLAALAMAATATASLADWNPPGPIKMLIGFRAGGGADTQARLIAEALEDRLGWKIIPEQVTGKGGLNLAAALRDAPSDGTVIGLAVTETLGYNMAAANTDMTPSDFTGIATTAGFQMGIVALSTKGWTDFNDVIAAAKAGEQIRFGAMSPKLADLAYLLGKANGVAFNIVVVRGGKAVMDGVTAGDLDLGFMAGIQNKGVIAGDLVNLASALSVPLALSPDAPTLSDLGVPFNADGYFVFIAPAGLPEEARAALSAAIADVVTDESTKAHAFISRAFGAPTVISGGDLSQMLARDYDGATELLDASAE